MPSKRSELDGTPVKAAFKEGNNTFYFTRDQVHLLRKAVAKPGVDHRLVTIVDVRNFLMRKVIDELSGQPASVGVEGSEQC